MKETFEFTAKLKKTLFYMMGVGVLGLLLCLLSPANHQARLWSNILANTYFFTGIGLFGLFAVAAGQVAYGHWQTMEKRIFISLSAFTRVGGFLLVLIIVLGMLNVHHLYDQANKIVHGGPYAPSSVFTTKKIWFAPAFWISRLLIYALLWLGFSMGMDKFFARTDQKNPMVYKRSKLLCAAFLVVFAATESFISWDAIMSLDTGWYSTLFGWYNFASYGCACWAMAILLVIYLKSQGYIERINENHVHDLGKLLFGFSVFWAYLWFDQFMLQWFANIPDETDFWVKRFDQGYFKFTIFLSLIINFGYPLLFLITKGAKRNFKTIGFGAVLLIFGHYLDFFNFTFVEPNWNKEVKEQKEKAKQAMIKDSHLAFYSETDEHLMAAINKGTEQKENTGAAVGGMRKEGKENEGGAKHEAAEKPEVNFASMGVCELLVFIGFLGVFLYMFFNNLSKRPIIPEVDPYLKENEKLVVTYA